MPEVAGGAGTTSLVRSSQQVKVAVHDVGGPGRPGTPTLLFTHATGFHGRVWAPVAGRLTDRFGCAAVDLRGHGVSETPVSASLAWAAVADDVLAVVDALGERGAGGPLHGIGHSMGGAALVLAAARRPEAFRSLWLFDPAIVPFGDVPPGIDNPMAEAALRRRARFSSFDEAIERYGGKPPLDALHPDALAAYVRGGFAQDGGSVRLRCDPATEAAFFRGAPGSGAWEALAEVGVPVAVVVGRVEALSPAAFAARIVERLPAGVLLERPGLGHFGPLEDPAWAAVDIADWVAAHP
ncbi:MAG: alpha/beta fold hydrolase [Acidimicrobiales bacterium]